MYINKELCVNCEQCIPYCPVGAIELTDNGPMINCDECVECGTCLRASGCPVDAFTREELQYPRIIRYIMSDPSSIAPNTSVGGRGTVEMKTNDVTGRFAFGDAGFAVEVGRPGVGTRMHQVEKVAQALSAIGVTWEPENPISALMEVPATGTFKQEVLNEKVLSAILEFKVRTNQIDDILQTLNNISKTLGTVFVVSVISKLGPTLEDPNLDELTRLGYSTRPNLKVNLGMGKPLFHFAGGNQ